MGSRPVILRLEFDYHPNLVRGVEDASRVLGMAYASKDLGHHYCMNVISTHNNVFDLEIKVPDGELDLKKPFISPGAGVTFRFGAAGVNDQGTPTIRQVGSAYFGIDELLVNSKTSLPERPLIFPNLEDSKSGTVPQKGSISLVVHPTILLSKSSIRPVGKHDFVPQNYPDFEQVLIKIQQRAGKIHQELRPTQPNTVGLKMPIWRSGHLVAPGAMFAVPRSKPASETWWLNCVIAATRRAYPELRNKEQTIALLERGSLTESERMNILMLAHTAVVAAGTCYVSDGIYVKPGDDIPIQKAIGSQSRPLSRLSAECPPNIKSCVEVSTRLNLSDQGVEFRSAEDFSIGWARIMKNTNWGCFGSIDCEDGGADICMQAMDFMTGEYKSPVLRFFREAADNYDVSQLLKYVNGAELADSLNTTNRLGGHMDAGYISRDYENRLRENGSAVHPVLEGYAGRMTVGARGSAPRDYVQNPVITGEGTGLMMPLADDAQAARMNDNWQYLSYDVHDGKKYLKLNFGYGTLRGVRYMMAHPKTQQNRFYNSLLSICPLRVASDYSAIEHVMIQTAPGKQATICTPYLDFLNGSPKNAARVINPINDEDIPYIQELLKHHMPVPAYEAVPEAIDAKQPQLERLCQQVERLGRAERASGLEYFQIYFAENDVRPESIAAINGRVAELSRVCKARYHFENWGKDLGTWCLTLHLNAH